MVLVCEFLINPLFKVLLMPLSRRGNIDYCAVVNLQGTLWHSAQEVGMVTFCMEKNTCLTVDENILQL